MGRPTVMENMSKEIWCILENLKITSSMDRGSKLDKIIPSKEPMSKAKRSKES